MAKRFYKVGEMVWVKTEQKKGKILSLDIPNLKAEITIYEPEVSKEVGKDIYTLGKYSFMDIDKLRVNNKKYNPNEMFYMVKDFHEAFGHPVGEKPSMIDLKRARARAEWMKEEIEEFLEATDTVGQADAMIDLLYFAFGTLVEMGVKPYNLFKIVQGANMGKLHTDENGNKYVKYREDGKVLKPENWERDFAPETKLAEEINRQSYK